MQGNFGNHLSPGRYNDDRGCIGSPRKAGKRYWTSEVRWWRNVKKHHHRKQRALEAQELYRCVTNPDHEFDPPRTSNDWCW